MVYLLFLIELALPLKFLEPSSLFTTFSTTGDHVFRFQVSEEMFANDFDEPTPGEVNNHCYRQTQFKLETRGSATSTTSIQTGENKPSLSVLQFGAND